MKIFFFDTIFLQSIDYCYCGEADLGRAQGGGSGNFVFIRTVHNIVLLLYPSH